MMDGSGASNYLAGARTGDDVFPGTTELPRSHRPRRRPHPTGHVRGFNDGELRDGEKYKSDGPLSPEQQALNAEWLTKIRRSLGDQAITRIEEQVNDMIPIRPDYVAEDEAARQRATTARHRTYFDRQK